MDDLREFLDEAFSQPNLWDDPSFYHAMENQRRRKLEQMRGWCTRNKHAPFRTASVREAQQRYVSKHPQRVKAAQIRHAKKKWQQTKNDQARLQARRAYQNQWAKNKRAA